MNLARSGLIMTISQLGGALVGFVGLAYFAQNLGPHKMGVFFLFQTLVGIFTLVSDFGLRGAVRKRLSEIESPPGILGTSILLKLLTLSIVGVLILVIQPYIDSYVGAEVSILLYAAVVAQELGMLTLDVLQGELRISKTAAISGTRRIFWVGGGALLLSFGLDIFSLIYAYIASFLIIGLWGAYAISTTIGEPKFEHATSLFQYSRYNFVSSIGEYAYNWIDVAIIGLLMTQSSVAKYEYAWQVTLPVLLISRSIGTSVFPQISQWSTDGVENQLEQLVTKAIQISLFISIPAFIGGAIVAEQILLFVFNEQSGVTTIVLMILLAEKVAQSVHAVIRQALLGLNKPSLAARATFITLFLNVALNMILIPRFGLIGAAIATLLSFLTNSAIHTRYLGRYLRFSLPTRLIGWYSFSAILMIFALLMMELVSPTNSVFGLVIRVTFGAMVYLGVSFSINEVRNDVILPGIRAVRS